MLKLPKSNHIELELSSKCTVACPLCPRTFQPKENKSLWNKGNLSFENTMNFLPSHVSSVTLSGGYGDPVYNPDIHKYFEEFNKRNIDISFDTNGSYVKEEVWHNIGKAATIDNIITFSIDGTPDNFTNYRVNGDWPSIEKGIKILVSYNLKVRWKYIVFKYNSSFEDMKTAYDKASELGMATFQLVHSMRAQTDQYVAVPEFEDALYEMEKYVASQENTNERKPKLLITISPRTRRAFSNLEERAKKRKQNKKMHTDLYSTNKISPQCINVQNWTHFISNGGMFLPCCFMFVDLKKTMAELNLTEKDLEDLDTSKYTLDQIRSSKTMMRIVENFDNLSVCNKKCSRKE